MCSVNFKQEASHGETWNLRQEQHSINAAVRRIDHFEYIEKYRLWDCLIKQIYVSG